MVLSSAGAVVLVPFPFSDLSQSKLRPAVSLARANQDDWILCQLTSNPYADPLSVPILPDDFRSGSLRVPSYARPGKLFTAHKRLIIREIGILEMTALARIVGAVVALLQPSSTP